MISHLLSLWQVLCTEVSFVPWFPMVIETLLNHFIRIHANSISLSLSLLPYPFSPYMYVYMYMYLLLRFPMSLFLSNHQSLIAFTAVSLSQTFPPSFGSSFPAFLSSFLPFFCFSPLPPSDLYLSIWLTCLVSHSLSNLFNWINQSISKSSLVSFSPTMLPTDHIFTEETVL